MEEELQSRCKKSTLGSSQPERTGVLSASREHGFCFPGQGPTAGRRWQGRAGQGCKKGVCCCCCCCWPRGPSAVKHLVLGKPASKPSNVKLSTPNHHHYGRHPSCHLNFWESKQTQKQNKKKTVRPVKRRHMINLISSQPERDFAKYVLCNYCMQVLGTHAAVYRLVGHRVSVTLWLLSAIGHMCIASHRIHQPTGHTSRNHAWPTTKHLGDRRIPHESTRGSSHAFQMLSR